MADLLFIELGAVVTKIQGPTQCTIEPFCDPKINPTYPADNPFEIDLANSPQATGAVQDPWQYDQYIPSNGSVPIGPSWPGGQYEGIVRIREDIVKVNTALHEAWISKTSPGHAAAGGYVYEYQVVTKIDEATGLVQRYHGFHATVAKNNGGVLGLRVAHAGRSMDPDLPGDPNSPWRDVTYNPKDSTKFYIGPRVAEIVLKDGQSSGAVFINLAELPNLGVEEPKLPPGAGGASSHGPGMYFVLPLVDVRRSMEGVAIAVQRELSKQLGANWQADDYEGVVYIREDIVNSDEALAVVVATLPGHPWEHQAIAEIDKATGAAQHYLGFHAEIKEDKGNVLMLEIANTGTHTTSRKKITYDPADSKRFYAGPLVWENVVKTGKGPGFSGAVFITPEAATEFELEVPDPLSYAKNVKSFTVQPDLLLKVPEGTNFTAKLPEPTLRPEALMRIEILLPTLPPSDQATASLDVPPPSSHVTMGANILA